MPVSNDIFDLIKGMNRKEKSFFRRYLLLHSAGKNGVMLKIYKELTDYCSVNDKYDETKFKKRFKPEEVKHFPVVKNKLYNLLLKSLNEYSEEMANEPKVKNLIEQSDILFSRSLLKQSQNALRRARKIAVQNEMFLYIHTILIKEGTLARYMLSAVDYESEIERISAEINQNLEKLKNASDMNDLGNRFTLFMQKYPTSMPRDAAALNETKKILEHPLLQNELLILSDSTRKRFYNLKIVACEWEKDYISSLSYAKKYSGLIENELADNKASVHEYIVAFYSLLVQSVRAGDYKEYEKAFEKLNKLPERAKNFTERDRTEVNYYIGLSVFSIAADGKYPEWGNSALKDAEENSGFYERTLNSQQKIIWYFVIARYCYFKTDYAYCGKWLNKLISMPNIDLSQDYQCYARIMNIIVAYESGNPDLIEHAMRKAFYFLTKRNKVYNYERIILGCIRQAFRVKTESEITEMLELMHRDLSKIQKDPFEQNAFDAFNIMYWLERKIKK